MAHPHQLPSIAHRLEISRDEQEQSCDPEFQPQVEEAVVGMASDKPQPGRDPRRFAVDSRPKTAEAIPQRHVAGDGGPHCGPDLRSPGEGGIAAEGRPTARDCCRRPGTRGPQPIARNTMASGTSVVRRARSMRYPGTSSSRAAKTTGAPAIPTSASPPRTEIIPAIRTTRGSTPFADHNTIIPTAMALPSRFFWPRIPCQSPR